MMTAHNTPFRALAMRSETGGIMARVGRGREEPRKAYYFNGWVWGPSSPIMHAAVIQALDDAKTRLEFMEMFPGEIYD